MNTRKYNWILYLITATIITTIAVQLYWNYKNFQENRRRITNEIQISLDTAIEEYFSSVSKDSFFSIISRGSARLGTNVVVDTIQQEIWVGGSNTSRINLGQGKSTSFIFNGDSLKSSSKLPEVLDSLIKSRGLHINSVQYNRGNVSIRNSDFVRRRNLILSDSTRLMRGIESVFIALTNDSINFSQLDSLFSKQLKNKGIEANFYFEYFNGDSLITNVTENEKNHFTLFADAKSTFLRNTQQLKAYHSDPTMEALKKSSTGIILSFLLSLAVVGSLFYLLKIINKQKELAEIKNDLISNITHEFKTPIATVSTAIEAIENFNVIEDKEKTQRYLSMSSVQLKKLHQMVEKLLETATLDSEKLMLKKEEVDLVDLVKRITKKHQLISEKQIDFSSNVESKFTKIDLFHFENAVSNLVDNAIKYGGETIEINITSVLNSIEISVADNGTGIEKNQLDKIFDKFYRVSKGNRHDVKGFGIGLYYTKKIVEKHGGKIQVDSNSQNTIFKISLPHE